MESCTYARIPAEQILHTFITERINQPRGVPWMHSAMTRLNNLGAYEEAEIVAARIGAAKMEATTGSPSMSPAHPSATTLTNRATSSPKSSPAPSSCSPRHGGADLRPRSPDHVLRTLRQIDAPRHILGPARLLQQPRLRPRRRQLQLHPRRPARRARHLEAPAGLDDRQLQGRRLPPLVPVVRPHAAPRRPLQQDRDPAQTQMGPPVLGVGRSQGHRRQRHRPPTTCSPRALILPPSRATTLKKSSSSSPKKRPSCRNTASPRSSPRSRAAPRRAIQTPTMTMTPPQSVATATANGRQNERKALLFHEGRRPQKGEIEIYEQIGDGFWSEGIGAKSFSRDLKALGDIDQLDVRINSPGGSVFEGTAIYNILKAHKAQKTVYVDGIAASIASVIAMAGDTVVMPENAIMMIHNPFGLVQGNAEDMRKMADALDKVKTAIISAYAAKSGMSDQDISDLMDDETWMTAQEAKDRGFADTVAEPVRIAASFDLSIFAKAPTTAFSHTPQHVVPQASLSNTTASKEVTTMALSCKDCGTPLVDDACPRCSLDVAVKNAAKQAKESELNRAKSPEGHRPRIQM
ncbi:MAG: ATP-dependent Clp protease proteolytic subunit [Desulfobacterales bacterium]|nr:ATP-dependent Clp protease proteolytic subunit [Desulfobacterales bacterium]